MPVCPRFDAVSLGRLIPLALSSGHSPYALSNQIFFSIKWQISEGQIHEFYQIDLHCWSQWLTPHCQVSGCYNFNTNLFSLCFDWLVSARLGLVVALLGVWSVVEGRAPRKGRVRQQVDCFSTNSKAFFGPDRCLASISGSVTGRGSAPAGPACVQGTEGSWAT